MERIYLIEDCNALKYVGRTKNTLKGRMYRHKSDKKRNHGCTSEKLDLENCSIKCIDIADSPEEAHELEEFYINSIDCVNHRKGSFDQKEWREKNKEYDKKWREKNKDEINRKKRERRAKNRDEINRKQRERRAKIKMQALAQAEVEH